MSDQRIRRNAQIVGSKLFLRPLAFAAKRRRSIDRSEQKILRDRQLAHQRVVLIDDGEAELPRLQRIGGDEGLAHDHHPALVGDDRAAGNAEERALARAVLAEHGVDLARPAFEIDPVERLHARIALRDAEKFE